MSPEEQVVVLERLVEQLADAVFSAAEFFNARDEMNAKVHLSEPRLSPITVMCNDAVTAWRHWKYPDVQAADHVKCHSDIDQLLTEIRYLREALGHARRVINLEQHDVIEEIDMALAYRVDPEKA